IPRRRSRRGSPGCRPGSNPFPSTPPAPRRRPGRIRTPAARSEPRARYASIRTSGPSRTAPPGAADAGYLNEADLGGYRCRRRACHRENRTAAAATTITIVTVSRPGTAPTFGGAPPRILASTEVDALEEMKPEPDAIAV